MQFQHVDNVKEIFIHAIHWVKKTPSPPSEINMYLFYLFLFIM